MKSLSTFRHLNAWWIDADRGEAMGFAETDTVLSTSSPVGRVSTHTQFCFIEGKPREPYRLFELWRKYLTGSFLTGIYEFPGIGTYLTVVPFPGLTSELRYTVKYQGALQPLPSLGANWAVIKLIPIDKGQYGFSAADNVLVHEMALDDFQKLANSSSETSFVVTAVLEGSASGPADQAADAAAATEAADAATATQAAGAAAATQAADAARQASEAALAAADDSYASVYRRLSDETEFSQTLSQVQPDGHTAYSPSRFTFAERAHCQLSLHEDGKAFDGPNFAVDHLFLMKNIDLGVQQSEQSVLMLSCKGGALCVSQDFSDSRGHASKMPHGFVNVASTLKDQVLRDLRKLYSYCATDQSSAPNVPTPPPLWVAPLSSR